MKCNTRSGRIVREETRKERLTRPSNFVISPLSEGPILKCDFTLQRLARACKRIYLTAFCRQSAPLFRRTVAHATNFVLSDALIDRT
jgi:hypothetical protein